MINGKGHSKPREREKEEKRNKKKANPCAYESAYLPLAKIIETTIGVFFC